MTHTFTDSQLWDLLKQAHMEGWLAGECFDPAYTHLYLDDALTQDFLDTLKTLGFADMVTKRCKAEEDREVQEKIKELEQRLADLKKRLSE